MDAIATYRKNCAASDAARDAGLTTPDDVVRYDNIVYGPMETYQVLDLYRPKDRGDDVLPVIISVHGGAWVYGSKEVYQYYCMSLAQRGFAVINFTYRLAPEYKFPASLEDTGLAVRWTLEHADDYHLDKNAVFFVGDSAGAHILGLYAGICTNPAGAETFPQVFVPDGFAPKGIALNCGAYHISKDMADGDSTMALMQAVLPDGGTEEELSRICAEKYITENFPPCFLMTCQGDFLKQQINFLIPALTRYRIPFEAHIYGDRKKELYHVFHVNVREPEGQRCNEEECNFFKRLTEKRNEDGKSEKNS